MEKLKKRNMGRSRFNYSLRSDGIIFLFSCKKNKVSFKMDFGVEYRSICGIEEEVKNCDKTSQAGITPKATSQSEVTLGK